MAAYPSTGFQAEIVPASEGRVISRATDGTPKIRDYHAVEWFNATIIHPCCTETDKDAILTFYDTNKDSWNTFSDTSETTPQSYTMLMVRRPLPVHLSGTWWRVTTQWIGKFTP